MIFYSNNKNECVVSCHCGCGDSVQMVIEHDSTEPDSGYFYQILMDSAWNFEQYGWLWRLKKIWRILRNKDYYYSEIGMTKKEFEEFKEWINKF